MGDSLLLRVSFFVVQNQGWWVGAVGGFHELGKKGGKIAVKPAGQAFIFPLFFPSFRLYCAGFFKVVQNFGSPPAEGGAPHGGEPRARARPPPPTSKLQGAGGGASNLTNRRRRARPSRVIHDGVGFLRRSPFGGQGVLFTICVIKSK